MKSARPAVVPERLVKARKAMNMSQADLASEIGMSQQAINAIEAGQVQRPTKLMDIAAALGVNEKYLLGIHDEPRDPEVENTVPPIPKPETIRVPDLAIFGGMGGGGLIEVPVDHNGDPADPDQVRGYWSFPEYMVRAFGNLANVYAWEVRGDSMSPTLEGGSVVFVDTVQNSPPPDDIYAINYGDGLMVKRLKLVPRSDRVQVISDNDRYGSDELLREDVQVFGRIVGWFQWRG